MADPKWKAVHAELLESGDTVAVELIEGKLSYYCPKSGRPVNAGTAKALIDRELLRPCGQSIDPDFPQSYEAVIG